MWLSFLLCSALLSASPSATELLSRGDALLADLEYEEAAEELMRAASAPDATEDQRMEAHLKAGIAHRIVGRDVEARLNFRTVLLARPDTRLPPGTSPKVLTFFESVREEVVLERQGAPKAAPPAPDERAEPVAPFTRALVAGGITAGIGVVTLPLCGFCGTGLCVVCPGACVVGAGGLAGGAVAAFLGDEPLLERWLSIGAAAGAAAVAAALVGGAAYGVALLIDPQETNALGNGSFNEVADAVGLGAGVLAAVLAGAAAGGVVAVLAPRAPAEPSEKPVEAAKVAMAY
jgi:hypothetical protein